MGIIVNLYNSPKINPKEQTNSPKITKLRDSRFPKPNGSGNEDESSENEPNFEFHDIGAMNQK